ncbi:unnamed protein product [Trichogramma brassicae]|uniref:Chemosensory protein n=2 Tax=Trichogramma TaxID=7490 RepID=A0A6H5IZL0_9HYME|nr:ejaculatory bulb-specific protein 3 [Trichogramma pretiosum]CAB0040473.1 unnamed protein product [Trichogramma brassicae]
MKAVCVMLFCCMSVALAANAYTNKYDNVNVDQILNSPRLLQSYMKCMLDEGNCTPDGRELKRTLPDALATGCTKCNEKQKAVAAKVINFLMTKKANDWARLLAKYDPNGEFERRYRAQGNRIFAN